MSMQRCPKCNKILSPQESVCVNCGTKVDNHTIARINSIYHSSNIATLLFLGVFFVGALVYAFVNWIAAIIAVVILVVVLVLIKLKLDKKI